MSKQQIEQAVDTLDAYWNTEGWDDQLSSSDIERIDAAFRTLRAQLAAPVAEPEPVIALLLDVVRCAHNAMDNTEDDGEGLHWFREDFDALSDAMDALDALPDDRPDYVMGPAAKAEWVLRHSTPAAAPAQPETWKVLPSPGRVTAEMLHQAFPEIPGETWPLPAARQAVWERFAERVNARLAGELKQEAKE